MKEREKLETLEYKKLALLILAVVLLLIENRTKIFQNFGLSLLFLILVVFLSLPILVSDISRIINWYQDYCRAKNSKHKIIMEESKEFIKRK
ncbi:MAG: hypothetical protein KAI67_05710 [Candidatus Pacebacteria bacterium]|nr:hypothetical protein [Candidatus Paceibacterota bacterium]